LDELAQIETEASDPIVARVVGEVDISNVDEVRRGLTDAVPNSACGLVVDLRATTHLDSSGVHLLFGLAHALEARQQQICVVAPRAAVSSRVLFITGFDRIVPVTDTVDQAVERIRAGSAAFQPS
jgi:anti-anti-sigma factor